MTRTTVTDATVQPEPGECWCCGRVDDRDRMVHLGNHPEVALCRGCARWAAKQASEIDDRDETGSLVAARNFLRAARGVVLRRGWHRCRVLGGPIRWIGKRLP